VFRRGGSLLQLALRTGAPVATVDVHPHGAVVLRWTNPAMAELLGLAGQGRRQTPLSDVLTEESGLRLGAAARDLIGLAAQSTSVQVRLDGHPPDAQVWFHLLREPARGPEPVRQRRTSFRAVLQVGLPPAEHPSGADSGTQGRELLVQRLTAALLRLRRRPSRVVLVMAQVRRPDGAGYGPTDELESAELTDRVRRAARDTDTVVTVGPGRLAVLAEDPADDGGIAMARRVLGVLHQPLDPDTRPVVTVTVLEVADADADPEAVLAHLGNGPDPSSAGGGLTVLAAWERGRSTPQPGAAVRDTMTEQRIKGALESGRFVLGHRPVRATPGVTLAGRGVGRLAEVLTVDDGVPTPVRVDAPGLAVAIDGWALRQVGELDDGTPDQFAVRLQPGGSLSRLRPAVEDLLARRPGLRLLLQVPEPRLGEAVSAQRAVLGELVALGVALGVSDWTGVIDVRALVRWRIGLVELSSHWEQDVLDPAGFAAVTAMAAGLRAGIGPTALLVADEPDDARARSALAACGVQWTARRAVHLPASA
jgi:hypothetical protein